MFWDEHNMNYLFYVGIIIPTVITILLFLVFIYCWFLQKARKEVLTKKYDPHGKMRQLGMSMDPPPPPAYCRIEDSLLPDAGEDNIAYDVSRSPSTEQEARGRGMYQTYHDSGISAGLSPSQESEPRPGLAYRTCPDSGISGFGPLAQSAACEQQSCRGCFQAEQQVNHSHSLQQLYGDQIQVHAYPQHLQQQQYHLELQQHLPQAMLHHNVVQASVHPTHGVCYGDDMTHPQSPQHYIPPPMHATSPQHYNPQTMHQTSPHHYNPQPIHPNNLASQLPTTLPPSTLVQPPNRLSLHPEAPSQQIYHPDSQVCYPNTTDHQSHIQQNQANGQSPNGAELPMANRFISPPSSVNFHPQSALSPSSNNGQYPQNISSSSSSPSPTKPLRHSNRDSGVSDIGQSTAATNADRPDSQASQSSTTDSEDSGFRSSHCAAHHTSRLSKQANPLLKPLRRTRNNKNKNKTPRTASSTSDDSQNNGATPLITLNPQNLQTSVESSNVIQNTALMEVDLAHRPTRLVKHGANTSSSIPNDRITKASPVTSPTGTALTFHDGSPIHSTGTCQHSPTRENWPPQSTNDQETVIKQNIDLNEISTHLSWKYLQDLSSGTGPSSGPSNGGLVLQPCHQGLNARNSQPRQEPHSMEIFGYSVV